MHQGLKLFASLTSNERMQFVHDDIAQILEHPGKTRASIDEQRLKRFWSDQ
ncbi:hypothetical protein D3C86_1844690 [compost metagenome]